MVCFRVARVSQRQLGFLVAFGIRFLRYVYHGAEERDDVMHADYGRTNHRYLHQLQSDAVRVDPRPSTGNEQH